MHFKIVGKLLLPKGMTGPPPLLTWYHRIPGLTQLVNLPAAVVATATIAAAADVDVPWRKSQRPAVLANCCNEITTKFSVCCIIKKFEKLLPKPGNNQEASSLRHSASCFHPQAARPSSCCVLLANYYKPAVMRRLQFLHDWQPNSPKWERGRKVPGHAVHGTKS